MVSKKVISLILILSGLSLVIGFGVYTYVKNANTTSGLKIETTPPSLVFIDNVQVGQTPLEKTLKPGPVVVKLIPDATSSAFSSFETQIDLAPSVYSFIRRDFAASDAQAAGEIITFQSQSGETAGLAVITINPPSAAVTLDGQPQGFTPVFVPSVPPGDHQLAVSSPGFTPRSLTVKTVAGYKANVSLKLASLEASSPLVVPTPLSTSTPSATPKPGSATPTPTPAKSANLDKPYVTISSTPTGFLRIRSGPGRNFPEVGQVKPGDSFPLLQTEAGWYLIKAQLEATNSGLPAGRQGWISQEYAKKYE